MLFRSTSSAFTVIAEPAATSLSPSSLGQGASSRAVVVSGSGFQDGVTAAFSGTGVTVDSVTYTNSTSIILNVSVDAAADLGPRSLSLTNPDAGTATLSSALSVVVKPVATSLSPSSRGQGAASQTVVVSHDLHVFIPP